MFTYLHKTRYFLLVAVSVLVAEYAAAQYKIHLVVTAPAKKQQIYLVGSFNDWNSCDTNYILKTLDGTHKEITVGPLQKGHYEFKLTRGTWSTVQSTAEGIDIDNYIVELKKDTTINITIAGWVDDYRDISMFPDKVRLRMLISSSFRFMANNLDSSYTYAVAANLLAKKLADTHTEAFSLNFLGNISTQQGNNAKALELFFQGAQIAEQNKDTIAVMTADIGIGDIFFQQKDYQKAKYYYLMVTKVKPPTGSEDAGLERAFQKLGRIYLADNQLDSAIYCGQNALKGLNGIYLGEAALLLGDLYKKKGLSGLSFKYYRDAVNAGTNFNNPSNIADGYQRIAQELRENNNLDSGFYYAKKAFMVARQINTPPAIVNAGTLLVDFFKAKNQLDSAFIYQQIVLQAKEILSTAENEKKIQRILFNQQLQQQQEKGEDAQYKSRIKIYVLIAGLAALLLFAVFLSRSNKHKQKANSLLTKQKLEIEKTLAELKAAQSQLIQSEKMASLGELTAGIAHEIQNPLNFVNNFSEVSNELIYEMNEELDKGDIEEAKAISADIKQNLEKINHHGKRADAIVKGMLQHSRKSTGVKELTDINTLADEYLRLSYHGLRAKDKTFTATLNTEYDEALSAGRAGIGKINIIPQDIGRVLINLFNNAFYAVAEKKMATGPEGFSSNLQGVKAYQPTVTLTTKKTGNNVIITVADNGNGIPQKIVDKIFQPFFTTKPTGQGTGLGLSLSYDVIKAHGGTINVETKEGEGTTFVIQLPIT